MKEEVLTTLTPQQTFFNDATGYNSRIFIQCNLPYRNPGNIPEWKHTNGNAELIISPSLKINPLTNQLEPQYPYGSIPRLILTYLASMAIKYKHQDIPLGKHIADFMRSLQMSLNTRNRRRLQDQILNLFNCSIRFQYEEKFETGTFHNGVRLDIAKSHQLWFSNDLKDDTPDLFFPVVSLGENFFKDIIEHGFPVDMNHIAALKKSPLGLDIYNWAVYRNNSIHKKTYISWRNLSDQFGNPYKRQVDFKIKALAQIQAIKTVWTDWNVNVDDNGFQLSPSRPPIKKITITSKLEMFNKTTKTYQIWNENGGTDKEYVKRLQSFSNLIIEDHEKDMLNDVLPSHWQINNLNFFRMSKSIIGSQFNELIHVLKEVSIVGEVTDPLKYFRTTLLNEVKQVALTFSEKENKNGN